MSEGEHHLWKGFKPESSSLTVCNTILWYTVIESSILLSDSTLNSLSFIFVTQQEISSDDSDMELKNMIQMAEVARLRAKDDPVLSDIRGIPRKRETLRSNKVENWSWWGWWFQDWEARNVRRYLVSIPGGSPMGRHPVLCPVAKQAVASPSPQGSFQRQPGLLTNLSPIFKFQFWAKNPVNNW